MAVIPKLFIDSKRITADTCPQSLTSLSPKAHSTQRPLAGATPTMHEDASSTDTTPSRGPVSERCHVDRVQVGTGPAGMCPSFVIDSKGRIITISFRALRTRLLVLNPKTLRIYDAARIPRRPGVIGAVAESYINDDLEDGLSRGQAGEAAKDEVFRDTSGGAYFFVDDEDRIVIPTANNKIQVFEIRGSGSNTRLDRVVSRDVPARQNANDRLTATLPCWDTPSGSTGYWYTTQRGVVGVVRPFGGSRITPYRMWDRGDAPSGPKERIQNSFSVGKNGAFIVSNYRLYRFQVVDDAVKCVWSVPYPRGSVLRPGQIDTGSGTTPTLLGDDFVAIGDGGSPMAVRIFHQSDGTLCDAVEVFGDQPGADGDDAPGSACENSFIYHDGLLIVGNTYGYSSPFATADGKAPGLVAFNVDPSTGKLALRWYNRVVDILTATPKLSVPDGLLYAYTCDRPKDIGRSGVKLTWKLIGVDVTTGKVALDLPLFDARGDRNRFDNAWATIALTPRGEALIGQFRGFSRVRAVSVS